MKRKAIENIVNGIILMFILTVMSFAGILALNLITPAQVAYTPLNLFVSGMITAYIVGTLLLISFSEDTL